MSRIAIGIPKLFTKQNVVTASRSLGTVFQNTTGKVMIVNVSAFPQAGQSVVLQAGMSKSTAPGNVENSGINQGTAIGCNVFFAVPVSWFYKVANGGSAAASSFTWVEWS